MSRQGGTVRKVFAAAAFAVMAAGMAAQEGQVYRPGKDVTAPRLVKEVKPTYTADAMRRQVQGGVELEAVVLANGIVREDVKVTRSLDPELDEQAVNALRQWEFKPGIKDGQPVPVQV